MRTAARPNRPHRLEIDALEDRSVPAAGFVAVGTDAGPLATVRMFADHDINGTYETKAAEFNPFGVFKGGVRVALGDFDGDENDELVTVTGKGTAATVKIWELNPDGTIAGMRDSFQPFGATFKGGLFVAAGDLNNDGRDELAVSTGAGVAQVKIYTDLDKDGLVSDNPTDSFQPLGGLLTGARLAMGDTNNTGGDELIVASGPGGPPMVKVYTDSDADRAVSDQAVLEQFLAYAASYRGGVFVATGEIQSVGSGGAEIITGPGSGSPLVKIFSDLNNNGTVSDSPPPESFLAYPATMTGGVRVAAGDSDDSGTFVEVITGGGAGSGGKVTIRDDTNDPGILLSDNPAADSFQAFASGGSFVAFGKYRTATYASTGMPQSIPDQSTITSSIFVPAGGGIIRDLDVELSLMHSFVGDLDVTLTHVPSGNSVVLFTDIGGTDEGLIIRLNDEAGTDIGTADNPADGAISGTFNLEGAALLSAFDGLDASGEWVLTITDDTQNDFGTLFGWKLDFSF
ncbi:MAG TPA: proprotein convertase P-domain-containing protein [Gemmataceae bacterium]|nr:proprotein convertase P-domain-containing protein [Gemmataceae bacterium]